MMKKPLHPDEYASLVRRMTPHSRHLRGCFRAFWVGGLICAIGQGFNELAVFLNLGETTAPMFTASVIIFLGTTLTGLGVYDRIGKYAGAGSIVPTTGFANSVAAPALEYRREGMIFGIGAKLFSLSGPVLVYGITSSVLVGVIYWVVRRWLM
ncbi:MAG: stage V sporulation protein AC [Christensenellales bacterium]|nr:stage V sporulation protein AC [Christensenellales bacterium]